MGATNLPLLEYDGDCGFCTTSAEWVRRRLPAGSGVSVEPWQSLDIDALGLSLDDVAGAAWWIDRDGRKRRGHLAIAAALRAIGGAWRVVGVLLTLPVLSQLARAAYWLTARYRYKLPGATDACRVDASH